MTILISMILLLPGAGALLLIFINRHVSRRLVEWTACTAVTAAFIMACLAFVKANGDTFGFTLYTWMQTPGFEAAVSILYDPPAAIMALMVTFIASLIHIYSVFFMQQDEAYGRYFCYLNLFVFSMLVITLADDLLFLFLGWEGVGFCSYALIGFWYRDMDNCLAGNKAFILTRIGDAAFIIAIALLFYHCRTLSINGLSQSASLLTTSQATLIGLLLLAAAAGKSAQLPLSVWLPDAMAGPTPVSALIHAATMVTAGVYLLLRLFALISISSTVMLATAAMGTVTAFYAACAALAQRDIKRVLAYSTISQVGYMFLGIGAGAPTASFFHLLCHAFFKALLFLGAGCIIQATGGEHDIRRMGATLRHRFPALFLVFLLGIVSLAAVPPSAGFFSKGQILHAAFSNTGSSFMILWLLAMFTAFLTALYSFRLLFLIFSGDTANDRETSFAALPTGMINILWPLAVLAVIGGILNLPASLPGGDWLSRYTGIQSTAVDTVRHSAASVWGLGALEGVLCLFAFAAAYLLYGPRDIVGWKRKAPDNFVFYRIFSAGFGLDHLYRIIFVKPYRFCAGVLWHSVDRALIDTMLTTCGRLFYETGRIIRSWSTGRLTTSLTSLFIGFTVVLWLLALKLKGVW